MVLVAPVASSTPTPPQLESDTVESPANPPVILFKTPADPVASDPYYAALSRNYTPYFVPVLQETFHLDDLCTVLSGSRKWEGVVMTSRRGAEAWVQAVDQVRVGVHDWNQVPLWTVGQTSRDAIAQAAEEGSAQWFPDLSSGGTAKSASALVPMLLSAPPCRLTLPNFSASTASRQTTQIEGAMGSADAPFEPQVWENEPNGAGDEPRYRPYLLIRGDKTLEEIPTALKESGREVVELVVYSTTARPDIQENIASVLSAIKSTASQTRSDGIDVQNGLYDHTAEGPDTSTPDNRPASTPVWLAFFSPSSAAFVLPYLPPHGRIFVIGETTRNWVEAQGLQADAVGAEPTALGMLAAMSKADAALGGRGSSARSP